MPSWSPSAHNPKSIQSCGAVHARQFKPSPRGGIGVPVAKNCLFDCTKALLSSAESVGYAWDDKSYSPARSRIVAIAYSRLSLAMKLALISAGQTASHSYVLVQFPNPSASIRRTMFKTRAVRSGAPCGRKARWETFAAVKSMADAFGHAAAHAPQPMQAAASIATAALF